MTRRVARLCALKALVLCLGCATPISVCRMDTREVYRLNSESVLTVSGAAVDLVQGDLDEARVLRAMNRLPSSVDNMNPSSPFIRAIAGIRVEPPVIAHSIVPVTQAPPADGQNDGVVEFSSASIGEARSELVVFQSGHSVQSHPEAIQEVRRILLEQLAEAP